MNNIAKTTIAILSVILMLGCTLLPFATCDINGSAADDVRTVDSDDISVSDFTKTAYEIIFPSIKERSGIFVPVEGTDTSPTPLETSVVGTKYVEEGNVVTLEGEYVFQTGEENSVGKYVIEKGATLVLFPLEDIDTSFKFINKNEKAFENGDIIQMESGSKLSIFGMTFEIELTEDRESFNLFSMNVEDSCKDEDYCSFTYRRNGSGNFEFSMYLNDDIEKGPSVEFWFGDDLCFTWQNVYKPLIPSGNLIYATGTIMPSPDDTGIDLSCTINAKGFLPEQKEKIRFKCDSIEINKLSMSYVTKESGADIKFSLSANAVFQLDYQVTKFFNFSLNGLSIDTGKIDFSVEKTEEGVSFEFISQDNIRLSTDNFNCTLKPVKGLEFRISLTNANIEFDPLKISMNYGPCEDKYVLFHSDSDIVLNIDKHSFLMSYSKTLGRNSISVIFDSDFDNTVLVLKGLTYDFDTNEQEGTYSIDQITSTKTLSKCFSYSNLNIDERVYIRNELLNLLYTMDFSTEVSSFDMTETGVGKDSMMESMGFDKLRTDFAVSHRSDEWRGYLELEEFNTSVLTNTMEFDMLLHNNVPITDAFSVLPDFASSNLGVLGASSAEIELDGMIIDSENSITTGDKISVDLKEFSDVDELNISFSGNVEIPKEDELSLLYLDITCDEIEGFVTNLDSEPKKFSVKDSPNVIFVTYLEEATVIGPELIKYDFVLEIAKGKASFEDGSLPFGIQVDSGVNFSAKDLTAFGFVFNDGCTMSGTVSIDTDAALPLFYDRESNVIKIGESYVLAPRTNGYVMTLDLSTKNSGTLTANDGCRLPVPGFDDKEFSMKSSDNITGEFTVKNAETGANVNMPCEKDTYKLTFSGTGIQENHEHGSTVTITSQTPEKEGQEFFGWSDGTRMYYPGDTFIMPKHDVEMTPVYCVKVAPEIIIEGDNRVLVVHAPNAEMVKIDLATTGTWDIMRVTVGNVTFEMTYKEYSTLLPTIKGSPCDTLYFQSVKIESRNGSGDGTMYDIKTYYTQYDWIALKEVTKELHRSIQDSTIKTTVRVDVTSNVKSFNVYMVDSDGRLCPVDGVTFVKSGNGSYDVTFDMLPCAQFVIEPVYPESSAFDGLAVAAVAAFVLLMLVGVCFLVRGNKH